MLAFDPRVIKTKRHHAQLARGAAVGLAVGILCLVVSTTNILDPQMRLALYILVAILCVPAAALAGIWLHLSSKYGPLTDPKTKAQLVLVRRSSMELDKELYAFERQNRELCKGEARLMLAMYSKLG